jgi:putative pyruvate formate lyase activating enzyme
LEQPLPVPVVYNTGGYEKVETLKALEGKVDIYLPDLKYLD